MIAKDTVDRIMERYLRHSKQGTWRGHPAQELMDDIGLLLGIADARGEVINGLMKENQQLANSHRAAMVIIRQAGIDI